MNDFNPHRPRPFLIGSTGHHARVLLFTITDKEFPAARGVLEKLGSIVEVDNTGAYTFADCISRIELPFVLVQSAARANLFAQSSVNQWIRNFRPQHILVIGTAGGINRPKTDRRPYKWAGPQRGDVVVSEYVHYAEFKKISSTGNLMRHMRMDQPSTALVNHAHSVIADGSWTNLAPRFPKADSPPPKARFEEILSVEAVQDNPLDRMQQFLMKHFDRAGATEMESAGVAHALHITRDSVHYSPGFLTIRGISDIIYARGGRKLNRKDLPISPQGKTAERDDWSPAAAEAASAFAVALTARLVKSPQAENPGHRAIEGYAMPQLVQPVGPHG